MPEPESLSCLSGFRAQAALGYMGPAPLPSQGPPHRRRTLGEAEGPGLAGRSPVHQGRFFKPACGKGAPTGARRAPLPSHGGEGSALPSPPSPGRPRRSSAMRHADTDFVLLAAPRGTGHGGRDAFGPPSPVPRGAASSTQSVCPRTALRNVTSSKSA